MTRHPHHFKISFALAIAAGSWGIYWLPQRILEDGGLTGGWGTISQMAVGILILSPVAIWRVIKGIVLFIYNRFFKKKKKQCECQNKKEKKYPHKRTGSYNDYGYKAKSGRVYS